MTRDRYNANPYIPDWSTVLAANKEDVKKSLLEDDLKWKLRSKSLATSASASVLSSTRSGSVAGVTVPTTSTTPSGNTKSTLSVSERLRKELRLTSDK